MRDFEESNPVSPGFGEVLKFERPDWSLFKTVEGLQQRAGVPKPQLRRLVVKELVDNGLDNGGAVKIETLPDGYAIVDDGPGIDPEAVPHLFSISRPMVSSKLLRLPSRGALGNGLRVVAGAVLASDGSLVVTTRNRRIGLRPERNGTTTVIGVEAVKFPVGTRVEIRLGPALPVGINDRFWGDIACRLAGCGTQYAGKSSPWWYDVDQFAELLFASGTRPVRELIANLDGCTGGKAGEIVARAGLERTVCRDVTAPQVVKLLEIARAASRQVQPKRLGAVGPQAFLLCAYAITSGVASFGATRPKAEIPFVVEAWAEQRTQDDTYLTACVNRTPVTGALEAARDKRDIDAYGCGLSHTIAKAPIRVEFNIWINITTPYMPITSDGKAPDLRPFLDEIQAAVSKAVRKAHRPQAGARLSQKDVVLENLDAVIAEVSGDGRYRFNLRQLLYRLRPIVHNELGENLSTNNFSRIITDYETEHGEIPGMYREPRGSIYHPHDAETITLGDLMVEKYDRPAWLYNKVVYIEKEGFSEALKAVQWPERHDCMLMSSKGFTTRAARDLVDKLAEHDEPVTIFCVHDADAHGTMIYQTFQEATKARGARKIKIVNLGLEPWEAVEMGLEVETIPVEDRRRAVAEYACIDDWDEWLQTHRVELNAMTTPEFLRWLDSKMAAYEKLIPPAAVLDAELDERIEAKVRTAITERILREAGLENQVAAAIAAIEKPNAAILAEGIRRLFRQEPDSEWRGHIETVARGSQFRETRPADGKDQAVAALERELAVAKAEIGALEDRLDEAQRLLAQKADEVRTFQAALKEKNAKFNQLLETDETAP
jgi:signal transduction histidine kinase